MSLEVTSWATPYDVSDAESAVKVVTNDHVANPTIPDFKGSLATIERIELHFSPVSDISHYAADRKAEMPKFAEGSVFACVTIEPHQEEEYKL